MLLITRGPLQGKENEKNFRRIRTSNNSINFTVYVEMLEVEFRMKRKRNPKQKTRDKHLFKRPLRSGRLVKTNAI